MRLAILGTRGIPARYGGFETFAEELGTRLVRAGHEVIVYCREPKAQEGELPSVHRGVSLRYLPVVRHKYLETPLHALLSFIHLKKKDCDVVLLCNAANAPFAWIVRLKGIPLIINVDGIERMRSKWNWLGRLWYRFGEICSVLFASEVVADADVIANYYRETYRRNSVVIRYGADPVMRAPGAIMAKFGLRPAEYLLYVSRLEPENNALGVIEAYRNVSTEMPLVIVGDAPYADDYKSKLRAAADSRVIFTGFQFGEAYQELRSHCYLYIQATEVGGTHPALVEAMAYGNCIVANGVPEHKEVLAEAGEYYAKNDFVELQEQLKKLLASRQRRIELGVAARERAQELYSWDKVVNDYINCFQGVFGFTKI